MRIIAGTAGGRTIAAPPAGTRPTSNRVRESLFAILDARIGMEGIEVLDLYAGSGAIGLEAVSRGAVHATLVESDGRAASTIGANISACGLPREAVTVVRRRVGAMLAADANRQFDVAVLDPPYALRDDVVAADLARLVAGGWLRADALVVVERPTRAAPTRWPPGLHPLLSRAYGDTRLDVAGTV